MSMIQRVPVWEKARGRWPHILAALGCDARLLSRRNCPCPMCGGTDRFRFTDHADDGRWICNRCGKGGGVDLVMALRGLAFREAAALIEAVIGELPDDLPPAGQQRSSASQLADMVETWRLGKPVTPTCAVGRWLQRRVPGVALPAWGVVRSVPSLRYGARGWPAMLCKILAPGGQTAVNIHRTWLTADGQKAPVETCRKVMAGMIPPGSFVPLFPPADGVLGIAEGVETALAAGLRFGVSVWAVLNAGNMQAFVPPENVKELMIFADNDGHFVGQAAAFNTARTVSQKRPDASVSVHIPGKTGSDWADV